MEKALNPSEVTSHEEETEFPASKPGLFSRIPKPLIVVAIFILFILMLIITFPGRKKSQKNGNTTLATTERIDSYEQNSPITIDPFSTESVDAAPESSSPVHKTSSFGSPQSGQCAEPAMLNSASPTSVQSSPAPKERGFSRSTASQEYQGYVLSRNISDRLSDPYQSMVKHFRETRAHAVEPVQGGEYEKLLERDRLGQVEPALKNLTESSARLANKALFTVPSGTRIRAVTQQEVNSDHPGYFIARITSPMELAGYKLLCQSRGNARDRIPVTADKIIAPDGKSETQIPGEVQMKYAGLEGDVTSHALKRLVPPVASALLGAGSGYLYFKAIGGDKLNSETGRINTADAVVSAPFDKGVSGVQNEVERFGGDYPNTVKVPQGTQFEILVTEAFTLEL